MKRWISFLLILVLCLSAVACSTGGEDPNESTAPESDTTEAPTEAPTESETEPPADEPDPVLLAGFAEAEFTPESGLMPGGYSGVRAQGTLGGLFANAAAFTCGDQSVILVSLDVLSFRKEYGDQMRQRISDATGVPVSNILVAAIHTHTGSSVEYQLWLAQPNVEEAMHTQDKAVEAAVQAWNNRQQSKLGVGTTTNTKFSFCRDWYMQDGHIQTNPGVGSALDRQINENIDQSIEVMRVDDADGNVKCFIVNYANHPDCHASKGKFSADYIGYMRRALKKRYGEDVKVLFFLGAAGDINCIDFENNTHSSKYGGDTSKDRPEVIGEGLAKSIILLNNRIKTTETSPVIQVLSEDHTTTKRNLTPELLEWATNLMKNPFGSSTGDFAFATEYLQEQGEISDTVDLEIHTIVIGPWAMVGLPSEIYSQIGDAIKEQSPYEHTIIASLANATNGYIMPDYVLDSTAYPARFSRFNSYTGHGTADMLIRESVRMLKELASKSGE